MSFLEVPSRIKDTMFIICDAVKERFDATGLILSEYDFFTPPYAFGDGWFQSDFKEIQRRIRQLYSLAFPPANFGTWSALRPNYFAGDNIGSDKTPQLDAAIAAELRRVGIAPSAFFWEVPHRFCDGDFVRACYHLLNNCILYFLPEQLSKTCKTRVKYHYGGGTAIRDGADGIPIAVAATGYCKDTMSSHFDMKFYVGGGFTLQGDWSLRYTSTLSSVLRDPFDSADEEENISSKPIGGQTLACHGNESEIFDFMPETLENISYYRDWGNFKYDYVSRSEYQTLEGILITGDNFPPLNYNYLD